MKTLVQKDLRGNFKLALVGLLLFALLLLEAYHACISTLANMENGIWSGYDYDLQPLLSHPLLVVATFFCAIFGALLGWVQTYNESHRDLWAFLIHRPVTRTTIFWGKTVAGMVLYSLGAGVPMAVLVAVVVTPGNVAAPFEWEMVLPLLAIFLLGVAFYFAGMTTGLRQARWYVSRSFGLGLAIAAAVWTFTVPIGLVLALNALVILILATAAWGNYQSGGFYVGQPIAGKLSLTVAMAAGCGVVLFVAVGLIFTLIVSPFTEQRYQFSHYVMSHDGTLYKVTDHGADELEVVKLLDANERALSAPKPAQQMTRKETQKLYGNSMLVTTMLNQPELDNSIQNKSRYFSLWNITDKTLWYLDRYGLLKGYDIRTRKYIGSLEAHGQDNGAPREPFLRNNERYVYYDSYNDRSRKLLPTAKSVYLVDFTERTVKPVFTVTNDDEIGGYYEHRYADREEDRILISTRKMIYLINEAGVTFATPYELAFSDYPTVQVTFIEKPGANPTYPDEEPYAIWYLPDYAKNSRSGWKMPEHIKWLGPNQTIAKSIDLPTLQISGGESWQDKLASTLLPTPLLLAMPDAGISSPRLLCGCLWAVISAAVGWRMARCHNFSTGAAVGWSTFILLLGVVGLLTFLCLQEWSAREPCPNCKKLRAVDRETCEHCGSKFAPPERNGTEIFEPLVSAN